MKTYFRLCDFVKLGGIRADIPVPAETFDKILNNFFLPLNDVRTALGRPIYVTSALRPLWWEKVRGRDGTSQHTFIGKGACDIALSGQKQGTWMHLFELLTDAPFKRIAYYPNEKFFHLDYRSEDRQYFIATPQWQSSTAEDIRTQISNG